MTTKTTSPGIAAWLARLEAELVEKGQIKPINQLHMELAKGARG